MVHTSRIQQVQCRLRWPALPFLFGFLSSFSCYPAGFQAPLSPRFLVLSTSSYSLLTPRSWKVAYKLVGFGFRFGGGMCVLQPWLLPVLEEGLGSSFHHVFSHFSFPVALFSRSTLGDLRGWSILVLFGKRERACCMQLAGIALGKRERPATCSQPPIWGRGKVTLPLSLHLYPLLNERGGVWVLDISDSYPSFELSQTGSYSNSSLGQANPILTFVGFYSAAADSEISSKNTALSIKKSAVKTASLPIQKSAAEIALLPIQKSTAKNYPATDSKIGSEGEVISALLLFFLGVYIRDICPLLMICKRSLYLINIAISRSHKLITLA